MKLYRRGKVWWVQDGGTRRSTGFADKKSAERCASRWQLERRDPAFAASVSTSVGDAVDAVFKTLAELDKSAGTVDMYKTKLGHVVRILGELPLRALGVAEVDAFFRQRKEEGASSSTMMKEWFCLHRVLRHAKRRGLFPGDLEQIRPDWLRTDYVPRETFLTQDQIPILLAELKPERREIVAFIIATGARYSEAMRFQPEDLNRDTWHVRLRGTKTARAARTILVPTRFRPLLAHVRGPFTEWPAMHSALAWFAEKLTKRHGAPFPRVTPNDLRRTFASLLVQGGAPLEVVAKLLGHTSTAMVYRVYGRFTPDTLATLSEPVDPKRAKDAPGSPEPCTDFVPVATQTTDLADSPDTCARLPVPRKHRQNAKTAEQDQLRGLCFERPQGDSNPC
jgi:integrase